MAYYLARWLSPRDRAAALATLATMSMVSGVAGGPLAAALLWLDEVAGLAGWQWLFLIEGLPAILIGWGVFRRLPDGPDAVAWLTPAERDWVRAQAGLEQQPPCRAGRRSRV
jgi:MFS family permease